MHTIKSNTRRMERDALGERFSNLREHLQDVSTSMNITIDQALRYEAAKLLVEHGRKIKFDREESYQLREFGQ